MRYLRQTSSGTELLSGAHDQASRVDEESQRNKETFEGSPELQAGAGNEINPEAPFQDCAAEAVSGLGDHAPEVADGRVGCSHAQRRQMHT